VNGRTLTQAVHVRLLECRASTSYRAVPLRLSFIKWRRILRTIWRVRRPAKWPRPVRCSLGRPGASVYTHERTSPPGVRSGNTPLPARHRPRPSVSPSVSWRRSVQVRLNYSEPGITECEPAALDDLTKREPKLPMIARPTADKCKPLHLGSTRAEPVAMRTAGNREGFGFGIAAPEHCDLVGLLVRIASPHATLLAWRVAQSLDGRLTGCLLDPAFVLSALHMADNPRSTSGRRWSRPPPWRRRIHRACRPLAPPGDDPFSNRTAAVAPDR
jgi:hypothetical protein